MRDEEIASILRNWTVGEVGTILHTEDGAKTWTLQPNLKADEGFHLFGVAAVGPDLLEIA